MISLSGLYLKIAHFPVKIGLVWGEGGSPKFVFHWNPPNFVTKEPMQKFRTLAAYCLVKKQWPEKEKFLLAPVGVLAPVSPHAGPSAQPPIGTSRNFSACMSAEWPSNIYSLCQKCISKVSEHSDNFSNVYLATVL